MVFKQTTGPDQKLSFTIVTCALVSLQFHFLRFFSTETCPKLNAPNNGKKFGSRYLVGHEVHFACDPGFVLVGSNTRVCLKDKTWSGQLPFCKNINECASNPCVNGGTCVDDVNRYACLCRAGWAGYNCHLTLNSRKSCKIV
ncbi:hypothetical protein chiPu_0006210 [Chiloscyllium punctatum]|uniref:Sushi domain-containing protein n=1 Tax=Chiloscyllium punctatum TaxID=137246 RepID=A0A401SBP0_CHIPU|nr:hypothetical protein [Chiloscyllium punctatum]